MYKGWVENLRSQARKYAYGGANTSRMYVMLLPNVREFLERSSEKTDIPMGVLIGIAIEDLMDKIKAEGYEI